MRHSLTKICKTVFAIPRMLFWYTERLIPRNKNKWVFGAWFGERYSDNSRAIYEYVLKEMPCIKAMWLTSNKSIYDRLKNENKPVALLSSLKGKLFSLTASVAFITVERKEVNGFYLNGAKLVWLYHGMVMKYIMEDERRFMVGDSYGKKTIKKLLMRFLFPDMDNYNVGSITVTGEFFRPFFESAFKVDPSKIWVDGYPRNDVLFSKESEDIVKKYRGLYPTAKFIIHMPTHRLHGLKGQAFNPFEGYGFNKERFYEILEQGDYVYFYKGHFYDAEGSVDLEHGRFVRITDQDFDILYRLVKDMDILITDYSSVYFDFLLLRRPIILTPFDFEQYIVEERPLYYDYNKYIEANKVYDWDEVFGLLQSKSYKCPSDELISRYIKDRDGDSCERIVKHIQTEWM